MVAHHQWVLLISFIVLFKFIKIQPSTSYRNKNNLFFFFTDGKEIETKKNTVPLLLFNKGKNYNDFFHLKYSYSVTYYFDIKIMLIFGGNSSNTIYRYFIHFNSYGHHWWHLNKLWVFTNKSSVVSGNVVKILLQSCVAL